MRREHGRRSDNIEDRRGMRVSGRGLQGGDPGQCDTFKAARL
jgi:hypothetical protein